MILHGEWPMDSTENGSEHNKDMTLHSGASLYDSTTCPSRKAQREQRYLDVHSCQEHAPNSHQGVLWMKLNCPLVPGGYEIGPLQSQMDGRLS